LTISAPLDDIAICLWFADQAEIDHFWARLGDGGREGPAAGSSINLV
jgi:hypothetical protein